MTDGESKSIKVFNFNKLWKCQNAKRIPKSPASVLIERRVR